MKKSSSFLFAIILIGMAFLSSCKKETVPSDVEYRLTTDQYSSITRIQFHNADGLFVDGLETPLTSNTWTHKIKASEKPFAAKIVGTMNNSNLTAYSFTLEILVNGAVVKTEVIPAPAVTETKGQAEFQVE